MEIEPLGEFAWLLRFADESEARRWARAAESARIEGIEEIVPSYRTAAVIALPGAVDPRAMERILRSISPAPETSEAVATHRIPVLYRGEDLSDVARAVGLSDREVIDLHASVDYRVLAIGFQPGFAYLGDLPTPLDRIGRRATPRTRVPAGSVAIAAGRTGIYPAELPGGWNLLGRTPLTVVDLRDGYFPLRTGDVVRFRPIDAAEFERLLGQRA